MGAGLVEFQFIPKLLTNLNVGFQNPINKNLNAFFEVMEFDFLH